MRLAARHLACVFLLLATISAAPAHAAIPTTAGGRYIHALLWEQRETALAAHESVPAVPPPIAPTELKTDQRVYATCVRELPPPMRHSIAVHSVTSSRR